MMWCHSHDTVTIYRLTHGVIFRHRIFQLLYLYDRCKSRPLFTLPLVIGDHPQTNHTAWLNR